MDTAATSDRDCVQVVIALIVTPEGFPLGLRGAGWQHRRQHNADVVFSIGSKRQYGKARAHLVDGSRHSD